MAKRGAMRFKWNSYKLVIGVAKDEDISDLTKAWWLHLELGPFQAKYKLWTPKVKPWTPPSE